MPRYDYAGFFKWAKKLEDGWNIHKDEGRKWVGVKNNDSQQKWHWTFKMQSNDWNDKLSTTHNFGDKKLHEYLKCKEVGPFKECEATLKPG